MRQGPDLSVLMAMVMVMEKMKAILLGDVGDEEGVSHSPLMLATKTGPPNAGPHALHDGPSCRGGPLFHVGDPILSCDLENG